MSCNTAECDEEALSSFIYDNGGEGGLRDNNMNRRWKKISYDDGRLRSKVCVPCVCFFTPVRSYIHIVLLLLLYLRGLLLSTRKTIFLRRISLSSGRVKIADKSAVPFIFAFAGGVHTRSVLLSFAFSLHRWIMVFRNKSK